MRDSSIQKGLHLSSNPLLIGILLAGLFWVFESLVAFVFWESSFIDAMFSSDAGELWERCLMVIFLIAFAGYLQLLTVRRGRTEEALRESEERFRGLTKASFEGVAITDEGEVVEANEAFAAMFGYELPEVIGKRAPEFVAPQSRELVQSKISESTEEPYEAVLLRKDGTTFEAEIRGKMALYRDHTCRVTAVRDVSERKRSEKALRESERRFSTLLSNAPTMVYRCVNEPDWPMEFVSDYAQELTGYPATEFLKNDEIKLGDLILEEDRERIWDEVQAALDKHERFKLNYLICHKDGTIKHVEEFGQGIYDQDGNVLALEGLISDVTERKQAEEDLRKSESRNRATVDTATDAIITMTADGLIRSFNPAAERVFGYTAEEAVGQPLRMLMPERFRGPHEMGLRRYLETGEAHIVGRGTVEIAGQRKNG